MSTIRLDGTAIEDETSFHLECQRVLGFPAFYGKNWNSWIDCMSYLDDPSAGLSAIHVHDGEHLEIELTDTPAVIRRCPGVLQPLVECTAAVNERSATVGSATRISLTFLEGDPG